MAAAAGQVDRAEQAGVLRKMPMRPLWHLHWIPSQIPAHLGRGQDLPAREESRRSNAGCGL